MDVRYGQRYRELFEEHWWWRARENVIVKALRSNQPSGGWRSILDVGCGDGLFFDRLSEFGEVEGVEPNEALVSDSNFDRIYVTRFDESFRPEKRYSLILFLDVLEHMPDPTKSLRHAAELLEHDGRILATVPAFQLLWTKHDELNEHVTRYTKRSLRKIYREAGLKTEREKYFFYWTCPAKLGLRFVEKLFGLRPSVPRVPRRPLNQLLYLLCRMEQLTVGALPMPFGSSLLVLSRKLSG